jgi:2-oxoglutarate ferredoxin oxidoreductase subunit alpha
MTARRREKLKRVASEIPTPAIYGDDEGDILLVGWGSTYGPIHEAVDRARAKGLQVGQLHLRYLNPLANGLERIFARFRQIFVVELNDEGIYGYGQCAMLLRARYANPKIRSITKTDGLTFKVSEILEGVERLRGDHSASVSSYPNI